MQRTSSSESQVFALACAGLPAALSRCTLRRSPQRPPPSASGASSFRACPQRGFLGLPAVSKLLFDGSYIKDGGVGEGCQAHAKDTSADKS